MISELERRLSGAPVRGALMHLATLRTDGSPALCNVRYHATFSPDRLYFIAHHDRPHAHDLRSDIRVAGCIVSLGGDGHAPAEGVTFTGTARELPENTEIPDHPVRLSPGERLYRLDVTEWTLYDGDRPDQAPRVIPARP
ncbi:pyridoxamine 5'-phosphate oxidase family protein [Microtetraspora sp. AC03309]|uniref:pyridoxamine 5'-phosphate oxidase family protein n=1 Tax=Microtetraspora sp. AC03309 TaxID=2779376 RepID=UPI001E41A202|nr:pyridoxamine 5'-phosphate oxidase family protein [Microtetraspora sp. AC03309]